MAKRSKKHCALCLPQYDPKRRASPDPEIAELIKESVKSAGLMKDPTKPPKLSDKDIIEFIFFPVVNEGCR